MKTKGLLAAALALLLVGFTPAQPARSAILSGIDLPITAFADMVVDESHNQLFISGGATEAKVVVTDMKGVVTKEITSLPGAFDIELSSDGESIWVALSKGDAVAEISTATLTEIRRIDFPAGTCPINVAETADKLVVASDQCGAPGTEDSIYFVDLAGSLEPELWLEDNGLRTLATSPGLPGFVVARDTDSYGSIYVIDVTGAAPVVTNSRQVINLEGPLTITADGAFVTGGGGSYTRPVPVLSLPSLATVDTFDLEYEWARGAAWSGDGSLVAFSTPNSQADTDLEVFDFATGAPVWRTNLLGENTYRPGIALSGDGSTVYMMMGDPVDDSPVLYILPVGDTPVQIRGEVEATDNRGLGYVHTAIYNDSFVEIATDYGTYYHFNQVLPGTYYLRVWQETPDGGSDYFPLWYASAPGGQQDRATPIVVTGDGDVVLPDIALRPVFKDSGPVFASDIWWMGNSGITSGCNPPGYDRYCPNDFVTRGQMAAFLDRALGLSGSHPGFIDDDDSIFEPAIERLAATGITKGCNPAEGNTKFCPNDYVTRGQMAAFLHRAIDS